MALSLNAQTVPSRFQGKPVKMKLRIHSKNVQAAAKASSLGQLPLKKRQNRAGKGGEQTEKAAAAGKTQRDQPAQTGQIHHQRVVDPEKTAGKMAETEPIADGKGFFRRRACQQQKHQSAEGGCQQRQQIIRRQRGNRQTAECQCRSFWKVCEQPLCFVEPTHESDCRSG